MDDVLFISLDNLLRVALSVPLLYFAVIGFIRISGKRSTSQMNNFDWIVTVAMGSLVASGIVLKNVAVAEVWLAIVLLLALQYVVTRSIMHNETLSNLVRAEPTLLLHKGIFIRAAMEAERVSEKEIRAAIRGSGIQDIDQVWAVTLETDATFSVLRRVTSQYP